MLQFLKFLGKLTWKANNFELPGGSKIRDSDACRKRKANTKLCPPKLTVVPVRVVKPPSKKEPKPFCQHAWLKAWDRIHLEKPRPQEGQSKQARVKRASQLINSRQEAAFMEYWSANRAQSMQPRPADAPTATQRLEALRARMQLRSLV